jgi:hypothetical protein
MAHAERNCCNRLSRQVRNGGFTGSSDGSEIGRPVSPVIPVGRVPTSVPKSPRIENRGVCLFAADRGALFGDRPFHQQHEEDQRE